MHINAIVVYSQNKILAETSLKTAVIDSTNNNTNIAIKIIIPIIISSLFINPQHQWFAA